MITRRTTPRTTVHLWLAQLARTATSENAEHTLEKLRETAEPILAMTASSEAAPAADMNTLLDSGRYIKVARRYLKDNWVMLTGLKSDPFAPGEEAMTQAATEAVSKLIEAVEIEGCENIPLVSAICDRIAEDLASMDKSGRGLHGEGTGILLREILGLPGDAYVANLITDEAVAKNMREALTQLQNAPEFAPAREISPEIVC